MKKLILFCAALLCAAATFAQQPVPPEATAAQVTAGTASFAYISPRRLAGAGGGTTINITGNTNVVQVIQTNAATLPLGYTWTNNFGVAVRLTQHISCLTTSAGTTSAACLVTWTNGDAIGVFKTNSFPGIAGTNGTYYWDVSGLVLPGYSCYFTNIGPGAFNISSYANQMQIELTAAGSSVTVTGSSYDTNNFVWPNAGYAATATVATNVINAISGGNIATLSMLQNTNYLIASGVNVQPSALINGGYYYWNPNLVVTNGANILQTGAYSNSLNCVAFIDGPTGGNNGTIVTLLSDLDLFNGNADFGGPIGPPFTFTNTYTAINGSGTLVMSWSTNQVPSSNLSSNLNASMASVATYSLSPVPTRNVAVTPSGGFQLYTGFAADGLNCTETCFTNLIRSQVANSLQLTQPWIDLDSGWDSNTFNSATVYPTIAVPSATQWPDGMAFCIAYAHTNGFKVSLYMPMTWMLDNAPIPVTGFNGPWLLDTNVLYLNLSNYFSWGVDLIFVDTVRDRVSAETVIQTARALAIKSNNPVRVYINNDNFKPFEPWMLEAEGVNCSIDGQNNAFTNTLQVFTNMQAQIPYSGNGSWPSFNTIGFAGNNDTNNVKYTFALMAMAPFSYWIGTTNWTANTLTVLTNSVLWAIHQDYAGHVWYNISLTNLPGPFFAKARTLQSGDVAVGLWNNGSTATNMGFYMTALHIPTNTFKDSYSVFGQTTALCSNTFVANVNSNGAEVFVISGTNVTINSGFNFP